MYYMVHYSRQMVVVGPMVRTWTIRGMKQSLVSLNKHLGLPSLRILHKIDSKVCFVTKCHRDPLQSTLECGPSGKSSGGPTISLLTTVFRQVQKRQLLSVLTDELSNSTLLFIMSVKCYILTTIVIHM